MARMTPQKKQKFLDLLAETGNVALSARAVGMPRNTFYTHKENDEEFARAWDDALDVAISTLELEARRRALHGCEEPVYYQGAECGRVRKYSDTLTIFLLKAHRPEVYRERHQIDHSGEVKGGVLVIPATADPDQWAEAARKKADPQ